MIWSEGHLTCLGVYRVSASSFCEPALRGLLSLHKNFKIFNRANLFANYMHLLLAKLCVI